MNDGVVSKTQVKKDTNNDSRNIQIQKRQSDSGSSDYEPIEKGGKQGNFAGSN